MKLKPLWDIFEGVGVVADISNWVKLRFLSGFFKQPPQPTGGQNTMNPADGEKGLQDEQRTLLALFGIYADQIRDLTPTERLQAADTISRIFEKLTKAGRSGAIEKLRKILAFSGTTCVSRRPTGEKINGKDQTEEIRRVVPEDGKIVILGLHVMCLNETTGVDGVINRLDQMGILTNARDNFTEQGKRVSGLSKKVLEAFRETNVPAAEGIVRARLTEVEYRGIEGDSLLKNLREEWEVIPADEADNKEVAATKYLDNLHEVFQAILKKRSQQRPVKKMIVAIIVITTVLVFIAGAAERFLKNF